MIAAGEVVERPKSVVKELVENSIDAGADKIDIVIENGGISMISIADNGVGIDKDDLIYAFKPHATSKICEIEDLDQISTLGFRGEALASIASISRIEIVSRTSTYECAQMAKFTAGHLDNIAESAREVGTTIEVKDLFFNTPARLKFLKKSATEQKYIFELVQSFILSYPNISFSLGNEDGALIQHNQTDLHSALYSIYDNKTIKNMFPIQVEQLGDINVSGYISDISTTKPNRNSQTIIVNGRIVKDATISLAIERAYQNYLVKRAFPVCVVDICLPFDEIDINVHPSKTEVRFKDKNRVFGAVYHAILDTLDKNVYSSIKLGNDTSQDSAHQNDLQNDMRSDVHINTTIQSDNLCNQNSESDNRTGIDHVNSNHIVQPIISAEKLRKVGASTHMPSLDRKFVDSFFVGSVNSLREDKCQTEVSGTNFAINDMSAEYTCDHCPDKSSSSADTDAKTLDAIDKIQNSRFDLKVENIKLSNLNEYIVIGQAFSTYIIVQKGDGLYFIDQHAAHERILYDNFVARFKNSYSQPMLVPLKLDLSASETEVLETILPTLDDMGFKIEQKGLEYLIFEVPSAIASLKIDKIFAKLLNDISLNSDISFANIIKDRLAIYACRDAIKGGENYTRAQLDEIVKNLQDKDGNLPEKCPHGRPIIVRITKLELEKMFKRNL